LNTVLKVDGAEDYVQKYALNYITSAALAGYKDAAEAAVIKYFGAGNTLLSDAVNAELAYSNGNFDSVLTYAEAVKSSLQSSYRDVRKNVYKIAALVCGKKGDTAGVVKWYAEIDRTEPTDESRSDLVSAYIDLGISSENDREAQNSFLKALDIYNSIIAKTPADKINYAQILYGMKKYSESLKVLESITVKDTVLICKKSYVLALVHYELNYKQPNTESLKYCHEAVSYYNMLPGDQKKEIPVSSLESLMQVLGMRLEIKK
ncbi:MAG: hypothetical protein IKB72_02545, partial [Ruminococcus sp.]|nr:hypothetical protein [Ruminococcus sp.]